MVAYIGGIKSTSLIEHIIGRSLAALLITLDVLTLAALLTTTFRDPGRVPRGYHWIATASKRSAKFRFLTDPDRWNAFLPTFPDSSFAPALHATPHYGSRLYRELTKRSVFTVTTGVNHKHAYIIPAKPVNEWITYLQRNEVVSRPTCSTAADDHCRIDQESQIISVEAAGVPTEIPAQINNVDVYLKWCGESGAAASMERVPLAAICRHVRLPRTRHCRNCHCCVDRFDHHCVW